METTKLDPAKVDDICVGAYNSPDRITVRRLTAGVIGTCHPPSPLYISRAAALAAGIPAEVPISTVNRLCASGLQAIRSIAHAIQTDSISLGLAVGVESMTLKYVD